MENEVVHIFSAAYLPVVLSSLDDAAIGLCRGPIKSSYHRYVDAAGNFSSIAHRRLLGENAPATTPPPPPPASMRDITPSLGRGTAGMQNHRYAQEMACKAVHIPSVSDSTGRVAASPKIGDVFG